MVTIGDGPISKSAGQRNHWLSAEPRRSVMFTLGKSTDVENPMKIHEHPPFLDHFSRETTGVPHLC